MRAIPSCGRPSRISCIARYVWILRPWKVFISFGDSYRLGEVLHALVVLSFQETEVPKSCHGITAVPRSAGGASSAYGRLELFSSLSPFALFNVDSSQDKAGKGNVARIAQSFRLFQCLTVGIGCTP